MSITNRITKTANEDYNYLADIVNRTLDKVEINEESLTVSDLRAIRDAVAFLANSVEASDAQ